MSEPEPPSETHVPLRTTIKSLEDRLASIEKSVEVLAEAELDKNRPRPVAFSRGVSWFERYWLTRLMLAVGSFFAIGAILFSTWQFTIEQSAREEERAARRAEADFRRHAQVSNAWAVLLQRSGGNIGKAGALEFLGSQLGRLTRIDLSCRNIGDFSDGECRNPPVFDFVGADSFEHLNNQDRSVETITGIDEDGNEVTQFVLEEPADPELVGINFSNAVINDLDLKNTYLDRVNLSDVTARSWHLEDVSLSCGNTSQLDGFSCVDCDFVRIGYVPWQLYHKLIDSRVIRSVVFFPEDAIIENDAGSNRLISQTDEIDVEVTAVLSNRSWSPNGPPWLNPPLYLKAPKPTLDHDGGSLSWWSHEFMRPAEDYVFWEYYGTQDICYTYRDIADFKIPMTETQLTKVSSYLGIDLTPENFKTELGDGSGYVCGFDITDAAFKSFFKALLRKHYGADRFYAGFPGPEQFVSYACYKDFELSDAPETWPEGCVGYGGAIGWGNQYVAETGWPDLDEATEERFSGFR